MPVPAPSRPTRRIHSSIGPRRRTAMLLALPLGLALVTGCSGGVADSGGTSAVAPVDQSGGGGVAGRDESATGGIPDVAPSEGDAPGQVPVGGTTLDEKIVRTGDVSVDVDDITSAASRITSLVTAAGGSVGSDQRFGTATDGTADLVVRVPPDSFDSLLEAASDLGKELSRSVSAEDVSTVVADVDARVRSLQNSVDRLLALAAQAVSVSDLITVEAELSARQAELESLQAQQRALADQVSLATLSIRLSASSEPDTQATGFLAGLADGWNALLDAGRAVISTAGRLLPWIGVLLVIAVPLWLILRRRRRTTTVAAVTHPQAPDPVSVPAASEPTPRPE